MPSPKLRDHILYSGMRGTVRRTRPHLPVVAGLVRRTHRVVNLPAENRCKPPVVATEGMTTGCQGLIAWIGSERSVQASPPRCA